MVILEIRRRLRRKVGKGVIHEEIRRFRTDARTLDLGCGRSPHSSAFPNRIGVDIVRDVGVHVVADAHALPFVSGSFDQIVCSEVLEHLIDPCQAVHEMSRVLRESGMVVITAPFVYPVHEAPHDYRRYTGYGLQHLFSPHFDIREIRPLYTEEQTLAVLLQRIAFQRQDRWYRHYFYLLLAHLVFRFSHRTDVPRYQDISRSVKGAFLSAGYLLVGTKRKATT